MVRHSGKGMSPAKARRVVFLARLWCYLVFCLQTLKFRRLLGFWPDPAFPRSSNEKYAWRKAFDRNPLFTLVSDKLKAKQFAQQECPWVHVPQTLWEGARAQDIPDHLLQGNVVVKANHGSGWNHFIQNGEHNRAKLNTRANKWMKKRYGSQHAEWAYDGVAPCLFVEEMLLEQGGPIANEYKFYCGAGKIAFAFVRQLGPGGRRIGGVIDGEGKVHSGHFEDGDLSPDIHTPPAWADLCNAALQISRKFDLVRCDLYLHQGKVYFSEITVYTLGGYAWVGVPELAKRYTEIWDLRNSWFLTTPQTGWRKTYAQALYTLLEHDRKQGGL